jgi:hypothetical protein
VALLAVKHTQTNNMASWGFGSLWGGNAAKKKDSTKNAILGLRSTLEMLSKREKHLQNQMDEQDAIARKNVSTNKGGELSSNRLQLYMTACYTVVSDDRVKCQAKKCNTN